MSDQAALSQSAIESHGTRKWFEKWAFVLFIAAIAALIIIVITGVLLPPAPVNAVDWGRSIIDRFNQVYGSVIALLGTLMGPLGFSMTRGHLDERLIQQQGDK